MSSAHYAPPKLSLLRSISVSTASPDQKFVDNIVFFAGFMLDLAEVLCTDPNNGYVTTKVVVDKTVLVKIS